MAKRYAAIDIGTVTCRLLVADCEDGRLSELYRRSEVVNLGEGVDATGTLQPQAIDRVCAVVAQYRETIDSFAGEEPVVVRCLATSASRDASNADEFAARLAQIGVELMVIPGDKEAQLSFAGASMDFPGEALLVSDIGGGSTELIAGTPDEGIVYAHSFNIGARRATERLIASDPPAAEELAALAAWAHDECAPFFDALADKGFVPSRYLAVAGTSTSVVSIDKALDPYDPAQVHGQDVSADTLEAVTRRLASLPLEERVHVVGLQPNRAPIIVAGLVILGEVLRLSGLSSYTASETDILEGIILDAVNTNKSSSA